MSKYLDIGINQATNDIMSKNGKVGIVVSNDEVLQRVKTRLRRILGEWFLQVNAGLPYFDGNMLGGKNTQYVLMIIKAEILETTGVQDVTSITIDYNNATRKATVTAKIVISSETYSIMEEI